MQSAREELSSFWRARETQRFLRTLESSDTTTLETQQIRRYRADLTGDQWADLLAQALEELLLEEGDAAVLPIPYVRNWLGEWSKEIRRKQQGLLLTSAHRAKGLEFDHVVILDGRWAATSDAEDSGTPRRLHYVSMTRARETLSLLQLKDTDSMDFRDKPLTANHHQRAGELLQPLQNIPSVLERHVPCSDISDRRLDVRIMECTMQDVVLSFAGWRAMRSDAHRAIAALAPGDPLSLLHEDGQWKVFDHDGRQVGRMAHKWALPNGMSIVQVTVQGIFTRWAKDDEDEQRRQMLRSETWEVVVPQLKLSCERSPVADTHR